MTRAGAIARLRSRTRPIAGGFDLLEALGEPDFAWLREGLGFVAAGVAARIPVEAGPGGLDRAAIETTRTLSAIEIDDTVGHFGTGPVAVASLPFSDTSPGELVVPAVLVGTGPGGAAWITTVAPAGDSELAFEPLTFEALTFEALTFEPLTFEPPTFEPPVQPRPQRVEPRSDTGGAPPPSGGLRRLGDPEASRERWKIAVAAALEEITAGRLDKVVLARDLAIEARSPIVRRRVLDALRKSHPTCFTFASGSFVGASPELLLRRNGSQVTSHPMAGSVPLGTIRGDEERLCALRGSAKDLEEHRILVEAIVAGLRPVCTDLDAGSLSVVRLATVAHLATVVTGRLRQPHPSVLALVGALHPTPAVAGIPRETALRTIPALDGFDRGSYAGPIGWVDARGDGEWALALRCAELDDRRARLFAGAGIVAGSDPAAEWEETEAKLLPVLVALDVACAQPSYSSGSAAGFPK